MKVTLEVFSDIYIDNTFWGSLDTYSSSATGANTDRYIHDPQGIHSQEDSGGAWHLSGLFSSQ